LSSSGDYKFSLNALDDADDVIADKPLNDADLETMMKFALRLHSTENYDDIEHISTNTSNQTTASSAKTTATNPVAPAMSAARRADELIAKQMFDAKNSKLSTDKFDSINIGMW
jgi:hypothetical protein